MKIKTSELQGAALDWAVAKCEGRSEPGKDVWHCAVAWAIVGPIIEREKIALFTEKQTVESWCASVALHQNEARLFGWRIHQYGPTPLIAACRCYVASKLGDEVEVPDELI